jgi:two-component system sensor histidine kinase TctE
VQHFVQQAHKKSIDLGFDLHPTEVAGDRFLLRDLIDNLIDNAIRYSPPGAMVTVSCHEEGQKKLLQIEDNGPGIQPQDREKIFHRFYRLDGNTAGSGLGLAIVRDIVRDHDATIAISPGASGEGTLFTVVFP